MHNEDETYTSLASIREVVGNRELIARMTRQDIQSKYHGSAFGVIWSIATPITLLVAYWLVLGRALGAQWEDAPPNSFPLMMFSGLILHIFLSEVLGRATRLIAEHETYVKKVRFPLPALSVITVLSAGFHLCIALALLILGIFAILHKVPGTLILLPIVLAPLFVVALASSWIISALSAYLRDFQQIVPLLLTAMMFISPIFYPIKLVPESFQFLFYLNPVTVPIEALRDVAIIGVEPNWSHLAIYSLWSIVLLILGSICFSRLRVGFADVV